MNRRIEIALGCAILFLLATPGAQAQRPYDGIQAGLDAWRLAEERRQAEVAEQLRTNDELKFWSGLPTSRGEVLEEYPPYVPAARGYPAYGYEYGAVGPFGDSYVREQAWITPPAAVEPLPYVRRYGVGYAQPTVRQPVGRVEMQTGPNRWESHPVYDPPLSAAVPSPPVDSPWLDRTPYAQPRRAPAPAIPPPAPQPPLIEGVENGEYWPEQRANQSSTGSDPTPLPSDEFVPPPPPRER